MFRVSTTPIISTQNCNYSLRYCCSYLPPTWPSWPRWRQVAAQKIRPVPEAVVTVLCTPDDGCGWHPKHVEWTCRIINRLLLLHLVGQLLILIFKKLVNPIKWTDRRRGITLDVYSGTVWIHIQPGHWLGWFRLFVALVPPGKCRNTLIRKRLLLECLSEKPRTHEPSKRAAPARMR